ncbi:hypothetical protein OB920_01250 [Halobacteria archaeon HArc-gm2]|nr:hypothetical protein [Halobacteria archaeon HArc-gm2]
MNNRGQTPQDFVVGASILLVTIIATFTFVQGSVYQAYEDPIDGDLETASGQVATYLVEHYSVDAERNVLRYNESDGIYEELEADTDLRNLKAASGIDVGTDRRRTPNVNVTIVNSSAIEDGTRAPAERGVDSDHLAWGPEYRGQDGAASTTRIVRLSDPGHKCKTVCWLTVRAW